MADDCFGNAGLSCSSTSQIRAWIARSLEGGRAAGPFATRASRAWGAIARLPRPLRWRDGASIVVVGGSTLGGSGKTPLAVACAEELHRSGARVALVGHAYGGSPGRARIVSEMDEVRFVGDEARACAQRLTPLGIPVVVAQVRQDALDLALQSADVAVVDGPCQTQPRRATLALLAVDGDAPWGAGHCPPRGDLRAPVAALLAAVDRVVAVGRHVRGSAAAWSTLGLDCREAPDAAPLPIDDAEEVSRGAWVVASELGRASGGRYASTPNQTLLQWAELRRLRLGLWTTIARPDRILRALKRRGVFPSVTVLGGDHFPASEGLWARRGSSSPSLDLWLITSKCESHIAGLLRGPSICHGRVPIAVLDYALSLGSGLKEELHRIGTRAAAESQWMEARRRPVGGKRGKDERANLTP